MVSRRDRDASTTKNKGMHGIPIETQFIASLQILGNNAIIVETYHGTSLLF